MSGIDVNGVPIGIDLDVPGSSTLITLVTLNMTWSIAVPWKNDAALRVTPGIRVVIVMSDWEERVAIWRKYNWSATLNLRRLEGRHTRDNPGEGFASVLMITVSLSALKGLLARSNVAPPVLTCCRIRNDHRPRPPPMACSLRLDRVGMSFWKRWKLPKCPDPVAVMSSGTCRSCVTLRKCKRQDRRAVLPHCEISRTSCRIPDHTWVTYHKARDG